VCCAVPWEIVNPKFGESTLCCQNGQFLAKLQQVKPGAFFCDTVYIHRMNRLNSRNDCPDDSTVSIVPRSGIIGIIYYSCVLTYLMLGFASLCQGSQHVRSAIHKFGV